MVTPAHVAIATVIIVFAAAVTTWPVTADAETSVLAGESAPQFDTTGSQDLRPRWTSSGGPADDATSN